MAKMTIDNEKWLLSLDPLAQQTESHTLKTAKTYVDKDIEIAINVQDAEFSQVDGEVTAATEVKEGQEFLADEGHAVTIKATASKAEGSVKIDKAGWTDAADNKTIPAASSTDEITVHIKQGALGGEGSASLESAKGEKSVKISEGSGTFEVTAKAAGSIKVTTGGWLDADTTAETSGDKTYAIQAASVANSATEGSVYAEGHSGAVVSGGYLYINEGYIKDTKISLAEIVPDEANIGVTTTDALMYKTVTAYDKDGALVTGTMGDATLSAITANDAAATVDTVTVTAADDKSKFNVTGSKAIAGTTEVHVATTGYAVADDLATTGVISGTAQVAAELDVISLSASKGDDDAVKPELEVVTKNIESTGITTSQPEGFYVSVKADAVSKTVEVTPTVVGAGYGTADVNTATPITVGAGSVASDTYYVPVQSGSVEFETTTETVVNPEVAISVDTTATADFAVDTTGILTAAPAEGPYITLTSSTAEASGSVTTGVTTTITEGYQKASSKENTVSKDVTVAATEKAQYIKVFDGLYI